MSDWGDGKNMFIFTIPSKNTKKDLTLKMNDFFCIFVP